MKKLFYLFSVLAVMALISPATYLAQDGAAVKETADEVQDAVKETTEIVKDSGTSTQMEAIEPAIEDEGLHQVIKKTFIDGNPFFMSFVLACLILGLALCIERIVYLNMAQSNTDKILENVESSLKSGGINAAKDFLRNTKGPVASIFYQGLDRADEGIEMVEKSVVAYGGVQMGLLEKGLSWISLFIALAPMLGFMGTVIGMIDAFNQIEIQNNITPAIVAGGIKVALITTVSGLIVAIILQIFYNYILSKIDSIVNDMEDASISLIDMLIKHKMSKS